MKLADRTTLALLFVLTALLCSAQPNKPPGDIYQSGGAGKPPGDVYQSGGKPGDVYQSRGCDDDKRHYIKNGTFDRCGWDRAHERCNPLTAQFGMPDHIPSDNRMGYYYKCVVDPCEEAHAVCWGRNDRQHHQDDDGKKEQPNPQNQESNPQHQQSKTDQSKGPCNLQQLAGLIMQRYGSGFPIATVKVINTTGNRPTYLVLLPGMEWQKPGQATMAADALIAFLNIAALDAYRLAIMDAVSPLPRGSNLILAGHSQGGLEAQNVASSLVERWGFKVPQIISYGAPIAAGRNQGTNYLHVRARDEPLQALDKNYNFNPSEILLSNNGFGDPFGPYGSHNSYDKDSSGLSRRNVPQVSTLTTPCYQLDLTTLQQYRAPDLFSRVTGANQCPAQNASITPRSYRPKAPLPQPKAAMDRGLLLADENYLKKVAAEKNVVILVRDSSLPALYWIGHPGYKAKPAAIKGKTLKPGDLLSFPPAQAKQYLGLASAKGMTPKDRRELENAGYQIQAQEPELIVQPVKNAAGQVQQTYKFYSDTDLHGVYDANGNNAWTPELAAELKCGTVDQGIQHDPHDQWPDRNNEAIAKANYGPQIGNGKTITAIFPNGTSLQISTLDEMKQLYKAIGVNWSTVYPNH